MSKHPIQPLKLDKYGVLRFKHNDIVIDLLSFASERGFGLNEIACRSYSREDRQQLAQLLGYSLHGYGDLRRYVDDDAYRVAQLMAEGLDERNARIQHLEKTINSLRAALVAPMAELFGVHPDDLSANLPDPKEGDKQCHGGK